MEIKTCSTSGKNALASHLGARSILLTTIIALSLCIFFKIFASIITILYFLVYSSSDSSNSSNLEPPAYCVPVTVNQMRDDLGKNAVKAQSTYKNNWFEISGLLGTMDSDGYYFYLDAGPALFTFFSINLNYFFNNKLYIIFFIIYFNIIHINLGYI